MKKLLFFTSLFISFNFFGQLNLDWFTQMDQTSGSYFLNECTVYGIAESPVDGSVYVVGVFRGTVDFNPYGAGGDITSFGSPTPGEDPFIVKYNSSGVFQWVNKISNPFNPSGDQSNDRALSVVVDNSGFVYVHGDMYDGGLSSFLARYTSAGAQSYILDIEGYSTSRNVRSITVDNLGYIYVFDRFTGTADLNPGGGVDNHTAAGGYDAYIAKFNASTGAYQWGKSFGNTNYESAQEIQYDGGYVYVIGAFQGTVDFDPNGGVQNRTSVSASNVSAFIARYSSSTGAFNYAELIGHPSENVRPRGLEIVGTDMYVKYQYAGTVDFQPGVGTLNLTGVRGASLEGGSLVKYNKNTLSAAWGYETRIFVNDGSYLDANSSGVMISGDAYDTDDVDPTGGVHILKPAGVSTSLALVNFNTNGTFNWAYAPVEGEYIWNPAILDNSNGIYVGGNFSSDLYLDPNNPTTVTMNVGTYDRDGYLAHYTLCTSGTNTTSTAAICENQTKALTSTSTGGSWSIVSGGGSISGTTYTPANVSSNTSVTVRYTDGCGNTSDRTFTVNVYNIASNTTSTASICETGTKTLVGSPSGGTWSIISGGGSISGTTYTPANVTSNTSVTVRYTIPANGACPATTSDRTFTVNVYNVASNTTSTAAICETGTKTLVGSPSGGTWSIISGGGSISGTTYTPPNVTSNTSVTVRYTIPANGACAATTSDRTFTVNVYEVASNTTSTAAICETGTKTLVGSPSGGTWSIMSGGGSISGTTYTPANVASNTSVTVRYTIAANGGCSATTSDRTFTVNNTNTAINSTSTATICENQTKSLNSVGPSGTWSIISGGGSISGSTYTPANISTQTSVTIRLTVAANGACPGDFDDVTFLVDPILSPSITSSSADICSGATRALTATPSGGSWSVTSGPGSISGSTLTATGTGTIQIQYSVTNTCGTYTASQSITSVGSLSPSITSSGADLCNGSTRALTGTPSGGSWTVVSGPGSISGSTLTATGVGTVQIRYTVTNACGSYNTTQNITTVGTVSPSVTSSGADICSGATRALTATPSGGSWSVTSGPGSISGSTLTATGTGTIQIQYSYTNACGTYTASQSITSVGVLSPSITSSSADICSGATRALTGTPSGGSWSVTSGPGSITGSTLTATGTGTIQIQYSVTNACGTYTANQSITSVGALSPSITSSSADICNGNSRALTATPSGGSWSVTSGPGSITGTTLTATGTGTIQIQYSVTNACGTYTDNQSITVVDPVTPSITSSSADICNGSTRALTATPSGGSWSVTSGPGSISGSTLTATGTGTIQIQYSYTNACGTYTANQSITSVDVLSPNITSSTADICNGNSRALTATPSGGTWSVTSGPGSISGNTLTATGTGTIQVQYSVTNACGSYTDNQSITAVGPLAPAVTSSNADLCSGSSRALTGTPSGGTWSVLSGPGSVSGSSLTCSGVGTITIQYSVTNVCGTYTTTQNITGVDVLSPSITSSNSDMCIGDNRSLTGTPSGGTWSITSGGTFGNISGGNQLNATATGTITVQYSVTNACGTYTTTQNINVVSTVTPAITSSVANMCVGDKRQLTASPGGGNWTVLSGPGSIGPSDTLTATGSGTIQIRYSVSSSCGTGSDTVNITVNPVPTATITSSNSTLCVGSSRALTGTPVGGGWSVVSGPGSITGSTLTSLSSGTIVIEYAVTQSGCTGTTTQTINVVDSSNATWTSPGTVCENAGLTNLNTYLAPFATTGGVWSGHSSVTAVGILDPTGLAGTTLNIKYKVGTAPCQDSLTLTINIQNNVDPTWTNPTAICENAGLTDLNTYLSGSATTGGVWSGHPSVTAGGILNPTGLAGSSLTIKYKVGTSPCLDSMSHTFTINPASSGAWTNPVTVCENSPIIDLNTLITGNTGGTWAGTNVTVGGLFNPSGLSGSIAITYMVGTAPCADTVTQNVTVNPAADASWSIPTTICESQMFDLDTLLLPSATSGGIWSGPGVTGSIFDPFGLTAPVTIKYVVGTLGCADSLSITISTIAPSPGTPVVSLTVDTTCAGDTTTIMATGSGSPVVYNIWTASSGGTFLGQAPLTVNPSVTTTYYVEAIAPNLCPNIGGRQSIEVVVNPLPTANAGVDENICYGDSVTLVASGGGTYVWSNSTAGANNTVNPITTTNYIVYVTSTTGCTDSDTVTVNVQTTGSANAQDDAYTLTTGTLESIDVYSNDAGSVSTIMIVGGPFNGTATVGTGGVIDYISTLGYIGMDSLYYQICDPSCTLICDTAKLVIEVQNDLTIPTGMSPNNDGKNDFFNILGIEKYPDNELYVYNRWGDIVYQAVPYNNDWSGESINAILGDKVVEGTYFYILKLGTDLPTYKGYIEVKK